MKRQSSCDKTEIIHLKSACFAGLNLTSRQSTERFRWEKAQDGIYLFIVKP